MTNITQNEKALEMCSTTLCLQLTILHSTINNLLRGQISRYMVFSFNQNNRLNFLKNWANEEYSTDI